MRILYFYQYFTTPKGSYNTRVYEFTRRWAAAGDQVTVVTSVFDRSDLRPEKWIDRFEIEGVDVRVINIGLSNKHGKLRRILSFAGYALLSSLYALILPADVVVASSGPITVGLPGLIARWFRRKPLVFEVRDLWPEGAVELGFLTNRSAIRLARAFEHLCYRSASTVVALSEGMAGWIRSHNGIEHIAVVTNAADNALFDSIREPIELPDWTAGKRIVLYAGNFGFGDDCGQILDMTAELSARGRDDIVVVLDGDGMQRKALEERVAADRLPVRFLGLVSRQDLLHWLRAAMCTLCVTRNVPFYGTCSPNKMFDSFAAGTPMIQTTQGWIKQLFATENCGLTVPPNDAAAFAGAVIRLSDDDNLHQGLAANARRVGRERFDRDLLAERMRRILQGCLPAHKRAAFEAGTRPISNY